jgi:two-component system response regulator FixJ
MAIRQTVFLVDDDKAVRDSVTRTLTLDGLDVEAFGHPSELLNAYDPSKPGCLLFDLRLPQMNVLELYAELLKLGCQHPFIIITGHGSVAHATAAMREGAVDFLEKPFDRQCLLDRIYEAFRRDANHREKRSQQESIRARIDLLTPREREIMELVVDGRPTKQIARKLGIASKTVEVHRHRITQKMQTESVAQLVRMMMGYSMVNHTSTVADAAGNVK